jgi:phage protein D/phage baseplate assembly protein gpV
VNEQFASSLLVEVDGSPLPGDVAALLTYAYVDDSRNLPDVFVLRFRDPQRAVLAKAGFTIGAQIRLRVQTSDPGGPAVLMAGEVTAVELELDRTGTVTEVRGMDHAHRLFRGRRVAAYPNMTVGDVVRTVTERAGLQVGRIDTVPGVGAGQHEQISQDNVSDWELLTRLADLVGAQILVRDRTLEFRLPQPPTGAPDTAARATDDPLVLEANRNLIALRAGVTAAEQVPEVTVRGWDDVAKRPVSATAIPRPPDTELGADPVRLAETVGSPPYLVASPTHHGEAPVIAAADALAAHLGGAFAEVEGVAKGNPQLRAGVAVALANVGEPFQGRYTLTSTRHLFSEQAGYTTAFTISGRQERSLYGLASAGHQGSAPAMAGLFPAIVSDVRDPLELGRVRLTFPWLDPDFTSGWARLVQPGAGRSRGAVVLPEVGDEVLAGCAHGDLDTLYVLGGLYSEADPLPELAVPPVDAGSGEVAVRGFVSRTGHRLEFVDGNGGVDGVRLATTDDAFLLRLDRAGRRVEVVSEGEVTITAERGIRIDAGTGALELSGQSVSVRATGGDINVDAAGRLALSGTSGATMEGASVSVKGQGTSELTASGTVTVRGGMVRIN